jgi:hypothetical protein
MAIVQLEGFRFADKNKLKNITEAISSSVKS